MSRTQQLLKLVADDIQRDLQEYPALQEQLLHLHGLLLQRDAQGIESLNVSIATLVVAIRGRALRRSRILHAFQLDQSADGMRRLLEACSLSQRQELQPAWSRLADYTAECKRLNERNGELLAMQHEIISQLAGTQSSLYSPQTY